MKKRFSTSWKRNRKPRKQRKYRYNAPLHVKQKFVRVHLSKELRKKYGKRSIGLRKGDKVKVIRGQFKKHTDKVEIVDLKKGKVYVVGIEVAKKDGTKTKYPIEPSNLMITELSIDDKMREKKLKTKG